MHLVKHTPVTNQTMSTTRANIVVDPGGHAVYRLTGDSIRHPSCTKANRCLTIWPPETVRSPKQLQKGPGIAGRLGVWRRNGFLQVTLGGHPVYRFVADGRGHKATGEGVRSFGGIWHVVRAPGSPAGSSSTSGTTTTSTTATTSTTTSASP